MSRTSGRSLGVLLVDEEEDVVVREEVDCRILARGRAERFSSSSSSSEEDDEGDAESWSSLSAREAWVEMWRRFFFGREAPGRPEGRAQSGTG